MENNEPYLEASDQTNARPQLIHLKTVVTTTFGILDGKNLVKELPVQVQIQNLDPLMFGEAAKKLSDHQAKLQAELDQQGAK